MLVGVELEGGCGFIALPVSIIYTIWWVFIWPMQIAALTLSLFFIGSYLPLPAQSVKQRKVVAICAVGLCLLLVVAGALWRLAQAPEGHGSCYPQF
jgi:hypothetical protein